jgi:hypothetical protein
MSYVQTGSEFVTERKKEKLRLVAPCGTDLLHCVLGEPIVVEQFLENLLADLCLLRGRCPAKVVEADVEPLIHLLVDCMIPITQHGGGFFRRMCNTENVPAHKLSKLSEFSVCSVWRSCTPDGIRDDICNNILVM